MPFGAKSVRLAKFLGFLLLRLLPPLSSRRLMQTVACAAGAKRPRGEHFAILPCGFLVFRLRRSAGCANLDFLRVGFLQALLSKPEAAVTLIPSSRVALPEQTVPLARFLSRELLRSRCLHRLFGRLIPPERSAAATRVRRIWQNQAQSAELATNTELLTAEPVALEPLLLGLDLLDEKAPVGFLALFPFASVFPGVWLTPFESVPEFLRLRSLPSPRLA